MSYKVFKRLEFSGFLIVFIGGTLLHFFTRLMNGNLITIILGSANRSIWENAKTFALLFVRWSLVELCWTKLFFRQFVVAKTISLYCFIIVFLLIFSVLSLLNLQHNLLLLSIFSFLSVGFSFWLSIRITTLKKDLRWLFPVCIFALFAFIILYILFTPFPPHYPVFFDTKLNIYGIIPINFTDGATILDSLYGK